MTKQLSIDSFFKSSNLPKTIMFTDENQVVRKRKLSLKKSFTPRKSPKANKDKDGDVIDLCSEDEDLSGSSNTKHTILEDSTDISDSSQATVIYSPVSVSSHNSIFTSQTPTKLTPTHIALKVRSPDSINKYYSPSKKKALLQKSPVRKELFKNYETKNASASPTKNSNLLRNTWEDMDDKTIFLITIIVKYLEDNSIKSLLSTDSQIILEKCMNIVKPGLRLVCRLFWRKDVWYNVKSIKSILKGKDKDEEKGELDDPKFNTILRSLIENQLIVLHTDDKSLMTFDDFAAVLSATDLKQICKDFKLKNTTKKQDAVDALKKYSERKSIQYFYTGHSTVNTRRVLKIMSEKAGPCYRLSDLARRTIHKLYVLMYLGIDYSIIRDKKLELTLLYDRIKRETYPIDSEMVLDSPKNIFKNNVDFERYYKALIVYEDFLQETNINNRCSIVKDIYKVFKNYDADDMLQLKSIPIWLLCFTPLHFYVKIMNDGVQDLKKINDYDTALDVLSTLISQDVFRQHKKAEWYSEKSLILNKIGKHNEAAEVLLEGLTSNLSENATDILRSRVAITVNNAEENLKNTLMKYADKEIILEKNIRGVHIHKQPMDRTDVRGKLKYETRTSDGRIMQDVEEFSIDYYLQSGEFTHGKHWEGRIVVTMFFLLFWDIIYSKPPNCPGIFLTRFQKFPLDMFCTSFYENRRDHIESRLNMIKTMEIDKLLSMMHEIWESRPEGEQSGLHREREGMQWEDIAGVVKCAGGPKLAALCQRLASHFSHYRAGFPDLTLWNERTGQLRFVEVKSDTDKPSLKQLRWMHYLQHNDIDAEFCYVGVHTTRSKARAK